MTTRARGSFLPVVLAVLAGCGDEGASPAAIVVSTAGAPAAGVDVVFHDADGLPLAHVVTDVDGRAQAPGSDAEMITVLAGTGAQRQRATFVGVAVGDQLHLAVPAPFHAEARGTARLTVPAHPQAAMYVIEAHCATIYTARVDAPIGLDVSTHCLSATGALHVLATANDASGVALAATWLRGVAWTGPMDLTMPAWTDVVSTAVYAANAPADAVRIGLELDYEVEGLTLAGPSAVAAVAPAGGAALAVRYAPGFADRLETRLAVQYGAPDAVDGLSMLVESRAAPPASRAVDLATTLLPRVSAPVVDASDPARPAMTWTGAPGDDGADGAVLRFRWDETAGLSATWLVLVPPDRAAPVRVPALPAELWPWTPITATAHRPARVERLDPSWLSGYDALRAELGLDRALAHDPALPAGDRALRVARSGAY